MVHKILLKVTCIVLFAGSFTSCQDKDDTIEKPNVIVILSDDIGFSDIGCYGAEFETPTLDTLAANGIRFSHFYNAARCCPTRATILTGLYPHQAGVGYMTAKLGETSAYQGHIRHDIESVATIMNKAGYTTLHVGKWHVGNKNNDTEPLDLGFERGWYPIGRVNYWNTEMVYEDGEIRKIKESENKYLTDAEGDKAIEYIEYASQKDAPFFMYLAFNSAHWPLHAKNIHIKKYLGKFMAGWDQLRIERTKRIDSIGLVPFKDPELTRAPEVPYWNEIPEGDKYPGYNSMMSGLHDQADWDKKMAVYAAQIYSMDENIGRIVKRLKEMNMYENTVIMYLQDNGACAEGIGKNDPNEPGGPDSYIAYHLPWADLGNTPFRMYKHFVHEGGISTPFIFHWPKGMKEEQKGKIIKESFGHSIDIVPTCVDLADLDILSLDNKLEGQSLMPVIRGENNNWDRTIFWEHEGNRAIRKGDWKLLSRYINDYRYFENWKFPKEPRDQEWELYNIREDRWELNELSAEYPEKVEMLKKEYMEYYERIRAIPRTELIKGEKFDF